MAVVVRLPAEGVVEGDELPDVHLQVDNRRVQEMTYLLILYLVYCRFIVLICISLIDDAISSNCTGSHWHLI